MYIIFNKPYGVISQFTGQGHNTLSDFQLPPHIYPAGRLDKDSEGLLLLTDDGPFIEKFLQHHERKYWVQVEHVPDANAIRKLSQGVLIKSGWTKPCNVEKIDVPTLPTRNPPIRERKNVPVSWIEICLTEGKNRQIRRMTAAIGYPTLRLIRVGLGEFHYTQVDLKPGEWIEVKKSQITG